MDRDRRVVLRVLSGAAIGVAAMPLGCPFGAAPAQGAVAAGPVRAIPVGALQPLDQPVAIGRDERGLYAMTTICTHRGCDIRKHGSITPEGLHCSCHGSEYDRYGNVTHGPAPDPLVHYRVEVAPDGRAIVHAGEIVPMDARAQVG